MQAHICACCVRGTALLRDAYTTKSKISCMVHAQVIFAGFLRTFFFFLIGQFALKAETNYKKENLYDIYYPKPPQGIYWIIPDYSSLPLPSVSFT